MPCTRILFFFVKVSDIVMEDGNLLNEDNTIVANTIAQQETPNTFGRNLLQRLGIAHGHTATEAVSSQRKTIVYWHITSSVDLQHLYCISLYLNKHLTPGGAVIFFTS